MCETARLREFTYSQHQVRTINPLHFPKTLPTAHPNGGHAIGCGEKRVVENSTKGRVLLGHAHPMHSGDTYIPLGFPLERLRHGRHCQIEVKGADAHTQDVGAVFFDLFFRPLQ